MSYSPWIGNLTVGGTPGSYGTVKLLLDAEPPSSPVSLSIRVEVAGQAAAELSHPDFEVEVFTNVDRRDFAKIHEPLADSGSSSSYWVAVPMRPAGAVFDNLVYEAVVPVTKCGAYRLTARYRRVGTGEWWWHNDFAPAPGAPRQRDCAVVVSPLKASTLRVYEANALTVEAVRGGAYDDRSTLDDFLPDHDFDGFNPFQLDYVSRTLGFNALWLMPVFPITRWRWDRAQGQWAPNDDPGSPYSVRDYWSINPWLADDDTAGRALELFQELVSRAHDQQLDVFLDMAFNHAGRDVAYGEGAVDLGLCSTADVRSWIREVRPTWCTRGTEFRADGVIPHYRERADNGFACATWAPADRLNEHVWDDANVDWFFGDYSSLGPKPSFFADERGGAEDERDLFYTDLGADAETAALWRYMGHVLPFWLKKTDCKLAGMRADFAQGLPNQLWEYVVNTTRQLRWDFVFLAEVLDPDAVQYRLNRVFDVLTTKDHYLYRESALTTSELVASLEAEARVFGPDAVLMHNGTSHDEAGNADKWAMVARYAVAGSLRGAPMVYMGQPLGLANKLPFREAWANMYDAWTRQDPERGPVGEMYRRINAARRARGELRAQNRYFLNLASGGFHDRIFAVARWISGATADSVVLVFVNLRTDAPDGATFAVPSDVRLAGMYQAENLVADDPTAFVWAEPRSAEDLHRTGIPVQFTYPNEIQYLALVPVG